MLLTTQYLDEADQLAGRIVIIDHGRTIAEGTPTELKRQIGGNVIEVHTHRHDQLATIAQALGRLDHGNAHVDEATRRVTVGIDDAGDGLRAALGLTRRSWNRDRRHRRAPAHSGRGLPRPHRTLRNRRRDE